MKRLATPLLSILHAVNRSRRALYRRGTLRSRRLPRPVVSIGNLSMGGSGKTPAVIALTRLLRAEGLEPAILTRGYRRESPLQWEVVRTDDVRRFGDEPVLMSRALPGTPIVVGADRFESGSGFLESDDCDLFLLDDGFQHLQLARDLDVLVVAPGDGPTREDPSAFEDADLLVVRPGAPVPAHLSVPTFAADLVATGYRRLGTLEPISSLAGRPVVAFSGLANNDQFFASLARLGAVVRQTVRYRDHYRYGRSDIELLLMTAAECGAELVTTEKDWVKIRRNDMGVIEAELRIDRPRELMAEILRGLKLEPRSAT